jgi:putative phosphoesterase
VGRGRVANAQLGVLSDTHGWLDDAVLRHFEGVELIVHAGDVGDPSVLDRLASVAPVTAVVGNIDGGRLRDLPEEAEFEFHGLTFAIRHIAGNPWRPSTAATKQIAASGADVFICGHSHVFVAVRIATGCLWLNPGAAGRQGLHTERTAALVGVDGSGELQVRKIVLGTRGRPSGGSAAPASG